MCVSWVTDWLVGPDSTVPAVARAIRPIESPLPADRDTEIIHRITTGQNHKPAQDEIIRQQQYVQKSSDGRLMVDRHRYSLCNPRRGWLWGCLAACVVVALLASCRVDVNEFSLNAMYANRLVRCYLGASRRKEDDYLGTPGHFHGPAWDPNRITGFDPGDDVTLTKLRIGLPPAPAGGQQPPDEEAEQTYWGPFPLLNTALNLVAGERLAWQERRAESFLLSPEFCGSKSLGYRKTDGYAAGYDAENPLTLGRCVAISGAAANPNMGYHSSPAVAALLTLFNVRLGWWLPNPREDTGRNRQNWRSPGPRFLLKWLAIELASFTNSERTHLNVSDGGHFENLGVYELVRRRCRVIIVSDAGADPDFKFEDLGGMIRKCRTDFGIDIEIDTSHLRPSPQGRSKWHCAVGTIRYDHVDPTAPVGTLVYIKPSLTGDEPADVLQYAPSMPAFRTSPRWTSSSPNRNSKAIAS